MKLYRCRERIAALCLVLLFLLFCPGVVALAADADMLPPVQDSGVQGPADAALASLMAWFESEERYGGAYTLTGDIVWPRGATLPIGDGTIQMNGYGIRIPAGVAFSIPSPYRFEGGGSDTPMFTVEDGAYLALNDPGAEIAVEDGCAVLVKGSDTARRMALYNLFSTITARGENAVAVRGEQNLVLENLRIRAESGAVSVEAQGDARLFLCEVEGEAKVAGTFTVDTSTLTPVAENAQVILRTAALAREDAIFPLLVGLNVTQWTFPYWLTAPDGDTIFVERTVSWDAGLTAIPGIHTVTVTPEQYPADVGVLFPADEVKIITADPELPYLLKISSVNGGYYLQTHNTPRDATVTLYGSADGGAWEQWKQYAPGEVSGSDFFLPRPLEPGVEYLFQMDVERGGSLRRTNLLRVKLENGKLDSDVNGGDRDDSDREEDSELPPPLGKPPGETDTSPSEPPAGGSGNDTTPGKPPLGGDGTGPNEPDTPTDTDKPAPLDKDPAPPNDPSGAEDIPAVTPPVSPPTEQTPPPTETTEIPEVEPVLPAGNAPPPAQTAEVAPVWKPLLPSTAGADHPDRQSQAPTPNHAEPPIPTAEQPMEENDVPQFDVPTPEAVAEADHAGEKPPGFPAAPAAALLLAVMGVGYGGYLWATGRKGGGKR